ncbi:MAG: prepilin-type N-terminal cleavage/methylation domain-containing protein [Candidatus Sumerlaeota bacterium]|nr:prepilin-type N-terminal cleavage/methylation domain-containing protein [Candidatus Sumerlaeota bacterium]
MRLLSRGISSAFTLIELLIVIAIIAILALIAIPNFLEAQTRSKVAATQTNLRTIAVALEAYFVDYSAYPPAPNAFIKPAAMTETWRLTTPVAYIAQIPKDIFFAPQAFGTPGGAFGPGGSYLHYIADPTVDRYWLLWSYGPDRDMEFTNTHYDPSNGTISDGDIYRSGALT